MSMYAPLRRYLESQKADRLTLTFAEITDILGNKLPDSAYKYNAWWANDTNGRHVHANEWLSAGFKTEGLSLTAEKVTFVRE